MSSIQTAVEPPLSIDSILQASGDQDSDPRNVKKKGSWPELGPSVAAGIGDSD